MEKDKKASKEELITEIKGLEVLFKYTKFLPNMDKKSTRKRRLGQLTKLKDELAKMKKIDSASITAES